MQGCQGPRPFETREHAQQTAQPYSRVFFVFFSHEAAYFLSFLRGETLKALRGMDPGGLLYDVMQEPRATFDILKFASCQGPHFPVRRRRIPTTYRDPLFVRSRVDYGTPVLRSFFSARSWLKAQ